MFSLVQIKVIHPIKKLLQNNRPVIMAILNLTPDSFSDGIKGASLDVFLNKAERLISEGADIIDIGAESTRPQAEYVNLKEERRRVIPFLKEFRKRHADFPVSLDTKKYEIAREAVKYHIQVLNDVSFLSDERFIDVALKHDLFYVLMHSRGDPQTMMAMTEYPLGTALTIKQDIDNKLNILREKGFCFDRLILDLGFGFAKAPDQCVELMNDLSVWRSYNLPLLLGISRKRFLQKYTGDNQPSERDHVSADLALKAFREGFGLIRTHNVKMSREIFRLENAT